MGQAADFYALNFYSAAERARAAQGAFRDAFRATGITAALPNTIEGFRALVDRLMEAGQVARAGALIALADDFVAAQEALAAARPGEASGRSPEDIAAEREGLERRLLEVQGRTAALRRLDLRALDASNRALQERIWLLEDQAAREAERQGLRERYWTLTGNIAALRRAELAALDPLNRALQQTIWRLEDAEEVANEREGLETRLLELQGNVAELRARELEALAPANRQLQLMIWGLEDAKDAMDALDPESFASKFDFEKALGLAGLAAGQAPGTGVAGTVATHYTSTGIPLTVVPNEAAALRGEVVSMRVQLADLLAAIRSDTHTSRRLQMMWDATGLLTRTA